jgi:hypothetical protein
MGAALHVRGADEENLMEEREWIEVGHWNLRSMTPGAREINASWGGALLDESGAVTHVSGRWSTGYRHEVVLDPETGLPDRHGRLVPVSHQDPHPTRETLLANGYVDRAIFPIVEGEGTPEIPLEPVRERIVAETTHVGAQDRKVVLEKVADPGELGAPVLLPRAQEIREEAAQDRGDYMNPFTDSDVGGVPEDKAPTGEEVGEAIASGRAEVLPS